MPRRQSHHHLRGDRRDPHADHVALSADHAEEIAEAAIGAAEAGAAIVHLHARDPETASPTRRRRPSRPSSAIKQRPSASSTSRPAAPYMTVEERVRPAATFKPEVASLNMGSINFGLYPCWSPNTRTSSSTGRGRISKRRATSSSATASRTSNTSLTTCSGNGTRFEFECYDIAPSLQAGAFRRSRPGQAAVLRPDRCSASSAASARHPEDVAAHEAHRRPPVRRSAIAGRCSAPAQASCAIAALAAAHGRQYPRRPRGLACGPARASSPSPMPSRWRWRARSSKASALEVATPDEAREILELKGGDKVAF